eukprot:2547887-Rhodomonas_salina.1
MCIRDSSPLISPLPFLPLSLSLSFSLPSPPLGRYIGEWQQVQAQREGSGWWEDTVEKLSVHVKGHAFTSRDDNLKLMAEEREMAEVRAAVSLRLLLWIDLR